MKNPFSQLGKLKTKYIVLFKLKGSPITSAQEKGFDTQEEAEKFVEALKDSDWRILEKGK